MRQSTVEQTATIHKYKELLADKFPDRDSATLNRQVDSVVKFLMVSSEGNTSRFIPLTRAADEVWHEMIVQTAMYRDLCHGLPGSRFIHHESIGFDDYVERVGAEVAVKEWLNWVPEHVLRWGPFTQDLARDWAVVQFLMTEVGMSLEDINSIR